MRIYITLSLIFIANNIFSQIIFTDLPKDYQLVGRNQQTNIGQFNVSGVVNYTTFDYNKISLILKRNNSFYEYQSIDLLNNQNIFNFNINIIAELANYSILVYSHVNNDSLLEFEASNIVSGDVYIIQGQSNAQAKMFNGSAHQYEDEFIRVYASGTDSIEKLILNDNWFIAQGDGDNETNGNTGQWGLRFAKYIVDSLSIPVAIFNQAQGGLGISEFLNPYEADNSLIYNYNKLLYRLEKNNLKSYVKAIFWAQGEFDSNPNVPYTISLGIATNTVDYKDKFNELMQSWQNDYSNLNKIYIFQTKNGCNKPLEKLQQIKEAQRQLAVENELVSIIPTSKLNHYSDSCHFTFYNGYQKFAERLFKLVKRDIYAYPNNNDIDAPYVYNGYKTYDSLIVIKTNSDSLVFDSIGSFFKNNNFNINENNIYTYYEYIIINNSMFDFDTTKISYTGNYNNLNGNYITNTLNIELTCFEDLIASDYGGWIANSNKCEFVTDNFEYINLNQCLNNISLIEDSSENIYGCTIETAINYDPLANINNGSCVFEDSLCDNTPTELFVNNIIHNRVQFNWTNPEDIPSYYMIRYRPYESNSWTVITAGTQNINPYYGTYRVRHFMQPNTNYEWQIRSRKIDSEGYVICQSQWSEINQYTTLPLCPNLENLTVSTEAIWATFGADAPATGNVWQARGKIREVGTNSYRYAFGDFNGNINSTKGNFEPSTDYEWHTKAWCTGNIDSVGNSDPMYSSGWGDFYPFSTQALCDKMPYNFTTTSNNPQTAITMSWETPLSGEPDHYFLHLTNLATAQVYAWNNIPGDVNSKTKYNLVPGEYSWKIRGACGINGTSWATPFSSLEYYSLGSNRIKNKNYNLNIFPNPSKDLVNISFEVENKQYINIKIINSLGQTILKDSDIYAKSYNKQLDLNNLPNGIYIISISTNLITIKESLIIID
tara:strand:+ start:321 stop:3149 length:2829 start_codon:yes stop_codon:yes gene_type:complete